MTPGQSGEEEHHVRLQLLDEVRESLVGPADVLLTDIERIPFVRRAEEEVAESDMVACIQGIVVARTSLIDHV